MHARTLPLCLLLLGSAQVGGALLAVAFHAPAGGANHRSTEPNGASQTALLAAKSASAPQIAPSPAPHDADADAAAAANVASATPKRLRLPDGTSAELLNGAFEELCLTWPEDTPFSPIVGRKQDAHGNEWYVHADGSQSTTLVGWREDLQRWSASAVLATPGPVVEVR